jgi:hypothetical protein
VIRNIWSDFDHLGAVTRAYRAAADPLSDGLLSKSDLLKVLKYAKFFNEYWSNLDDIETIDGHQMSVQSFRAGMLTTDTSPCFPCCDQCYV